MAPSGLNFTCSIWYSSDVWHPRLYIKGPGTDRYTGDPGVRTLSQAVKPGQQGMVYECGAIFKWSDAPYFAINNRGHYDLTNLPVINETCSDEVGVTTTLIKTTSSSMASTKSKKTMTTGNNAMLTSGKCFMVLSKRS